MVTISINCNLRAFVSGTFDFAEIEHLLKEKDVLKLSTVNIAELMKFKLRVYPSLY